MVYKNTHLHVHEVVKGHCIVTSDVMTQRTVPCTVLLSRHSTGGGQIRREGSVCACRVLWRGGGGVWSTPVGEGLAVVSRARPYVPSTQQQ